MLTPNNPEYLTKIALWDCVAVDGLEQVSR